jgi:hypothetical protein
VNLQVETNLVFSTNFVLSIACFGTRNGCNDFPPHPTHLQEVLFSSVIPDTSAKALSKYTEMVDSKSRSLMDKLAMATDNARLKLKV